MHFLLSFLNLASLLVLVSAQVALLNSPPSAGAAQPGQIATPVQSVAPTVVPTDISMANLPACVFVCFSQAAQTAACPMTNKTCACTNPKFIETSKLCLRNGCPPLDQAEAEMLQNKQCAPPPISDSSAGPAATGAQSEENKNLFTSSNEAVGWMFGEGNILVLVSAVVVGLTVAL
ncbi:hypothetical protein NP233_g12722 [Leucocoprinus birnbaumii]|uniref:CFEM domain-containing protein n=1 Tax=Leucocoprinus birnbaumii TaxID=56174 RepID=A0AAD5VEC0_9AGAR|nr:hypothetical protein NP233_g12722 [Leucocoprinus birnbaumii]